MRWTVVASWIIIKITNTLKSIVSLGFFLRKFFKQNYSDVFFFHDLLF